jgi:hypothetical protein
MSNLYTKRIQLGNSTANNNFVIAQPDTPNGTMVIGNGNIGSSPTTLVTVNNSGNITIAGSVSAPSVTATTIAASSTLTVGGVGVLTTAMAPYLGSNSLVRTNATTINENITIPGGTNGVTVGPITINTGFTVTVVGDWSVV